MATEARKRSNLSILERNMLAGVYRGDSQDLFFRGLDRDRLKAEQCAWAWDEIAEMLEAMVRMGERRHDGLDHGVLDFTRERVFRKFFPGN